MGSMNGGRTEPRGHARRWVASALSALVLASALAIGGGGTAAAQSPATDSLWLSWLVQSGSDFTSQIGVCASPAAPASMSDCFASPASSWPSVLSLSEPVTDGTNVYFLNGAGALSCPLADLGASCSRVWAASPGTGLAADGGALFSANVSVIYRCPADEPYAPGGVPAACVTIRGLSSGGTINALVAANGYLYAGFDAGDIERCDPATAGSCTLVGQAGATVNAIAIGGGYVWTGNNDGTLSRCDLGKPAASACSTWDTAGGAIEDISYDGAGTIYAAVAWTGSKHKNRTPVLWSCGTATANACTNLLTGSNVWEVEAGAGGVFSLTGDEWVSAIGDVRFGTGTFSHPPAAAQTPPHLLYVPAGGTVGVGGIAVHARIRSLGPWLTERCAGSAPYPKAMVRVKGPYGYRRDLAITVCDLKRGTTVRRSFPFLDPGRYVAKVRGLVVGTVWLRVKPGETAIVPLRVRLRGPAHG